MHSSSPRYSRAIVWISTIYRCSHSIHHWNWCRKWVFQHEYLPLHWVVNANLPLLDDQMHILAEHRKHHVAVPLDKWIKYEKKVLNYSIIEIPNKAWKKGHWHLLRGPSLVLLSYETRHIFVHSRIHLSHSLVNRVHQAPIPPNHLLPPDTNQF